MKIRLFFALGLSSFLFWSCGSKSDPSPTVTERTLDVESIIGTASGTITASRKGFINLADAVAYSQTEAIPNSDKVDFAYNYHGGGCSTCRFFENVKDMSTRTSYVSQFSTVTSSQLRNVEYSAKFTVAAFDSIKTQADFDTFAQRYKLNFNALYSSDDVTNRTTDVAVGRVFAFKDKNGKTGLFKIGNYTAGVPTGDRAPLTLTIKMKP